MNNHARRRRFMNHDGDWMDLNETVVLKCFVNSNEMKISEVIHALYKEMQLSHQGARLNKSCYATLVSIIHKLTKQGDLVCTANAVKLKDCMYQKVIATTTTTTTTDQQQPPMTDAEKLALDRVLKPQKPSEKTQDMQKNHKNNEEDPPIVVQQLQPQPRQIPWLIQTTQPQPMQQQYHLQQQQQQYHLQQQQLYHLQQQQLYQQQHLQQQLHSVDQKSHKNEELTFPNIQGVCQQFDKSAILVIDCLSNPHGQYFFPPGYSISKRLLLVPHDWSNQPVYVNDSVYRVEMNKRNATVTAAPDILMLLTMEEIDITQTIYVVTCDPLVAHCMDLLQKYYCNLEIVVDFRAVTIIPLVSAAQMPVVLSNCSVTAVPTSY